MVKINPEHGQSRQTTVRRDYVHLMRDRMAGQQRDGTIGLPRRADWLHVAHLEDRPTFALCLLQHRHRVG